MRQYFITGGTGFVGRALVKELLKDPNTFSITCLTRGRPNLIKDPRISYIYGCITEVPFPTYQFTDIIHGAAEANDLLAPDKPLYYYNVVEGTKRLMSWAKAKRLMYISSGAVLKGDSIYCRAKRLAESLCIDGTNIVRIYSLVGEEMPLNGQYALGKFIYQALAEKKIRFYESGSVRSYLHVEDCARWIVQILNHGKSFYDIGSKQPITIRDLALLVGRIANVPVEEIERTDFHQTSKVYVPGRLPIFCSETLPLEESIERTLAFCGHSDLEPTPSL